MKSFHLIPVFLCLLGTAIQPSLKAESQEAPVARELTIRGGLPNAFAKLEQGGAFKVAYFGGSITAQNGWRVDSRQWLQETFPRAKVREINAAIGGTGSELGVFRLENDALAGKPDLVFVEFAVNDAWTPPDKIVKAMEGIVRKTWRLLPDTDICFVYTVTARDTPELAEGKLKRSEMVMEQVAEHYGIPSVHFGIEVARLEKANRLLMKSDAEPMTQVAGEQLNEAAGIATDAQGRIIFSKDGVHPYPESGHVLYTRALIRALTAMRKVEGVQSHELVKPMQPDNWENARMLTLDQAGSLSGPVTKLDPDVDPTAKAFRKTLAQLWKFEPGAALTVKFHGTKLAIYDLLGPDGAQLSVELDGVVRKEIRFDGYCTSNRLGIFNIADGLSDGPHEVRITILADKPDKRSILFEKNRAKFDREPAEFEPTLWYAGAVLLVGDPLN